MPGAPEELDIRLADKDTQELYADLEEKNLVLPNFQRDFVWPTNQIGALLDSMLNGYYINTLLTLPVTDAGDGNVPFPPRPVRGIADDGDYPYQMEMVLDGQQRVTSIYYALAAPDFSLTNTEYEQLFYLDFAKAIRGEFDDEIVDWRRGDWSTSQSLVDNDFSAQFDYGIVPFTIFQSSSAFKEWRRGITQYVEDVAPELDGFGPVTRGDIDAFEDNTEVFREYEIPIIQMGVNTAPEKVVQTFERINTQGLELGIFDILTARLYLDEIFLRELWDQAVDRSDRLAAYSDEEGTRRARERTLRILALYRGEECKEESLGEMAPDNFETDWFTAIDIFDRVLERAKSAADGGLGVTDKYGFPYGSIVPPLANLIHVAESGTYPDRESLEKVHRWYWSSIFAKRYSGSSDTIAYRDYNEMIEWMADDDEVPGAIIEASRVIPASLELKTETQGGPYRGVMSLLMLNGAQDFGTFHSIDINQVDDHHIFPESKLKSGAFGTEYSSTARNRILNRTLIQYRNNRFKYRDRVPSDYVSEMIEEHDDGESGVRRVLEKHFINKDGFDALLEDNFDRFCAARESEIQAEIENRIGTSIDWSLTETDI